MMNLALNRKILLPLSLTALLVGGSASIALADHDPTLIHACVKNGNIRIVQNAGACKKKGGTHITLATGDALADLQGTNNDLQMKLDDLQALTKRLVGNKAAVVDAIDTSGTSNDPPGHYVVRAIFCDLDDLGNNPCEASFGQTLEWEPLTEADKHSILTYDAGNALNFQAIKEILTNGDNDLIRFEVEYLKPGATSGGGASSTGPERTWFFLFPQVSSGVEFTDLEGLDIESISLVIDRITLFYNQSTMQTSLDLEARVFFNLGP